MSFIGNVPPSPPPPHWVLTGTPAAETNPFYSPNEWVELPPLTPKEATQILVNETIWALKNRPHDFDYEGSSRHWLRDSKGCRWWVANSYYGLSPFVGPLITSGGYDVGLWNRHKLWRAISKWMHWYEFEKHKKKGDEWLVHVRRAALDTWAANRPEEP